MKSRTENRILNALLISLLSMLIPMLLATRVFGTSSYLSLLYMIGYVVHIISVFYVFSGSPVWISKNAVVMLMLYLVIQFFPLINDIVKGIPINYYDPINSIVKVINFILFYVLMENIKIDKDTLLWFMRCIVFLSVVACVYSIIFEFDDILSIRTITNTNVLKIRSFFSNRNQYSAFLVIAFISNLYSYQLQKTKSSVFIFVLQVFCILTTFSRAALFSALIIICLMLLQMRNAKKKVITLSVIFIIGIGVLFTTGVFDYFVENYIRWGQSADSGRFVLWKHAWEIAKNNFFSGVGFYTGVDIAVSNGMGLTQFHNMFFDLLVGGGVLEVLFIIGLLLNIYVHCLKKCMNKQLLSVYRASFVAFIFYACFESLSILALSYSDNMYSIFYISLPLLLSNIKHEESNKCVLLFNQTNSNDV